MKLETWKNHATGALTIKAPSSTVIVQEDGTVAIVKKGKTIHVRVDGKIKIHKPDGADAESSAVTDQNDIERNLAVASSRSQPAATKRGSR